MIAQRLKNNKIAIGSAKPRKDAIEIVEDLRVAEFFKLVNSARNWEKSLNDSRDIMFTTYENEHSKVYKEFQKILERRKIFAARSISDDVIPKTQEEFDSLASSRISTECSVDNDSNEETRKVNTIKSYKSSVIGTSRLLRIPSKQVIKIVRRKGMSDCSNKINAVCIDNKTREEFFADCKKASHFQDTHLYEIMYSEQDKDVYEKYDALITRLFEEGANKK